MISFGFYGNRPSRTAEQLQRPLLDALRLFEFHGVRIAADIMASTSWTLRFSAGVPVTLLAEWIEARPGDLRRAVEYLERRGFITETTGDIYKALAIRGAPEHVQRLFFRPDGKVVCVNLDVLPDKTLILNARCGVLRSDGIIESDIVMPDIRLTSAERIARITGPGLSWLEAQPPVPPPETKPMAATIPNETILDGPTAAARFYAVLTGTKPDASNASKRLRNADGVFTVAHVAHMAHAAILLKQSTTGSVQLKTPEPGQACSECGAVVLPPKLLWGSGKLCENCMSKRVPELGTDIGNGSKRTPKKP